MSAISVAASTTPPSAQQSSTSVCRYFASTGNCYYGDQCNFSHVLPAGVAPQQPDKTSTAAPSATKNAKPCRNITIHGYCKFQGKGCEYNHDIPVTQTLAASLADPKGHTTAPVVISKPPGQESEPAPAVPKVRASVAPFVPRAQQQQAEAAVVPQLQYNLPNTVLTKSGSAPAPGRRTLQSFFMSDSLRQDLAKRNALILARVEEGDPRHKEIPQAVGRYNALVPLEDNILRPQASKVFLYPTVLHKGVSSLDGQAYTLRKIEGFRPTEYVLAATEPWLKQFRHPSVVSLREVFATKDYGDGSSLVFAHEYHPAAITLESKCYGPQAQPLTEATLWSYVVQILSALKAIHAQGLACRVLHPSKIIVVGKNRIRINGVGIADVLQPEAKTVTQQQHEDLLALGTLVLSMACRTWPVVHASIPKLLEYAAVHYSIELKNFVVYLLRQPTTAEDVATTPLIAAKSLQEVENLHAFTDSLEGELTKELENGRLFRLMVKLGFINERPEFEMDPGWSETGDRYLLKLFRDYVFHQVYDDGTPVLDWGHVVECLNKFDVGVPERIMLMSRDEQSIIVVSYTDLKRCSEVAFNELLKSAATKPT